MSKPIKNPGCTSCVRFRDWNGVTHKFECDAETLNVYHPLVGYEFADCCIKNANGECPQFELKE